MFVEDKITTMCPFTKTEQKWADRNFYTYMKYWWILYLIKKDKNPHMWTLS